MTHNRRSSGGSVAPSVNQYYHDPIPSVYRPPRAVPMTARLRGAAAVLAALAAEAPAGTELRAHLEAQAFAVAALATGEARVRP